MDLTKLSLFNLMTDKMGYLSERQRVLTQNIANADTPGYQAEDLKPYDFKSSLSLSTAMPLATTNSAHMALTSSKTTGRFGAEKSRKTYETSPTGNQVVLEEQMMKSSQTAIEYQTITNLYRRQLGLIRTALGK